MYFFFTLGGKIIVCWSYFGVLICQWCFVYVMLWIWSININWIALLNGRPVEKYVILICQLHEWKLLLQSSQIVCFQWYLCGFGVCFRWLRESEFAYPYNRSPEQKREGTGLRSQLDFCELRILSPLFINEIIVISLG